MVMACESGLQRVATAQARRVRLFILSECRFKLYGGLKDIRLEL